MKAQIDEKSTFAIEISLYTHSLLKGLLIYDLDLFHLINLRTFTLTETLSSLTGIYCTSI